MRGEKLREIALRRQQQDREIRSVYHVAAKRAALFHQPAKVGFSSGAPPVMSTAGIWLRRSVSMHSSAVSRVMISRRSGPAST